MRANRSRLDPLFAAALLATLVVLALHAWSYRFLTDDAFISFRYARNLAEGHGLVFNPGFERVEGYTNFLWVLILAGLARLGVAPEAAANPLSLLATVALWAAVAWFALRNASAGAARWYALGAPLALALNRSVAIWSTSGLETRWFELLIVCAIFRWIVELERWKAGEPARPVASWLFGLAAWTRPDGLLFASLSFGLGAIWLARARRLEMRRLAFAWWPFAALVAGQSLFRLLYYGDWLPNTWYAKVGGALWWSSGLRYLGAIVLEYALWLWIPVAVWGAVALVKRGQGLVALLFAGTVVPYVLYVAAIGGDHFEYRLLDVGFPFLFLLAARGWSALATLPRGTWIATALLMVALVGQWELPRQSHRQFPTLAAVGFPGLMLDQAHEARAYLEPSRSPIYRWPGLRGVAAEHRDLLRWLTRHFVAIRQEEHACFAVAAVRDGRTMERMIEDGRLPRDLYVATGAVGAIPTKRIFACSTCRA